MAPSLSEPDALELLRTHCGVLRRRLVFDASRQDGGLVQQEWMSLLCLAVSTDELASGLGYELRVALDIVNALCSCSGFSPDRNHRFWREAVAQLWIEYSEDEQDQRRRRREYLFQPPTHMMLPFDRAAFSCFSIDFQEFPVPGFEPTLVELWRQVTWTDAMARCPVWLLDRRQTVLSQLEVVRPVRTLRIELIAPANSTCMTNLHHPPELTPYDWSTLTSVLEALGDRSLKRPQQELSIAFHPDASHCVLLHSSNLAAIQQLLCGCRFVQCLTLDVRFLPEADPSKPIALFGALLLALLVETKSLRTLRVLRYTTKYVVAAVCSVLPEASGLETLLLSGSDSEELKLTRHWEWLEYGLSHPLRRSADVNKLSLALKDGNVDALDADLRLQELRRSKYPLQAVVRDAIAATVPGRNPRYHWYEHGQAVARIDRQRSINAYLDPQLQGRPVAQVTDASALEPVAMIAQFGIVAVVVRGFGLCWVSDSVMAIESMPSAGERSARLVGVTAVSVSDGSGGEEHTPSALPVVRWLRGEMIQSLALAGLDQKWMGKPSKVLAKVLPCCPNLKTLQLETYGVGSLDVLVDAYASEDCPCQITSLSIDVGLEFASRDQTECLPLLEMLSDPSHRGASLLRHLSLDTTHGWSSPEHFRVEDVARMLATNSVLETVYVHDGDAGEGKRERNEAARTALAPFQDQVLEDCSRVAIGLLSVAMYYGERQYRSGDGVWKRTRRASRNSGVGTIDLMMVRHVLSFVGATRVRCVRWVCDQTNAFPSLTINRFCKDR